MASCVALALLLACSRAASPVAARPLRLGGWAPYWELRTALDASGAPGARVSAVFLFVAHLDGEGEPIAAGREDEHARAAEEVRRSGAAAWLTVVNDVVDASGRATLKDRAVVHAVLEDAGRRRRHREKIILLAQRYGVSGVDVDYENLYAADRERFTAFVAELAEDARRAGLELSVTVQPKWAETGADGAGAADWSALCRSADRLQVMLYNQHSARTGPGPIATPAWIDPILSFAATQCAREKIVPALKVIGMEWSPSGTRDVPFAKARALARAQGATVSRDAGSEVPWFAHGPGGERTVYYEDAQSLRAKLSAVRRHGAGEVMLWSLGHEDPALWSAVEAFTAAPRAGASR